MGIPSIRVLIVDDFEPWRQFTRSILLQLPNVQIIGEATDGLEAIQQAEAQEPDLILLDIGLPKLNGLEVASRLTKNAHPAKIIFLTAENDPDAVRRAMSNGAMGYIQKKESKAELLPAIQAVLRGDKFISRRLSKLLRQ